VVVEIVVLQFVRAKFATTNFRSNTKDCTHVMILKIFLPKNGEKIGVFDKKKQSQIMKK
jgi:hypothetical protein